MRYNHRFVVDAPLDAVREFHSKTDSMSSITPPPIIVQVHSAPERVVEGATMRFTLWMGPLPIRWAAEFSDVTPTSFLDTQSSGPFTRWEHRHTYLPIGPSRTEVLDEVVTEPGSGFPNRLISVGMALSLPVLFAFRAWRTRTILERRRRSSSGAHGTALT